MRERRAQHTFNTSGICLLLGISSVLPCSMSSLSWAKVNVVTSDEEAGATVVATGAEGIASELDEGPLVLSEASYARTSSVEMECPVMLIQVNG
jgi:hypothetical protein